jgi:hypothetical protein
MTQILNFEDTGIPSVNSVAWDIPRQYVTPEYSSCISSIPCSTSFQILSKNDSPSEIFNHESPKAIHIRPKKVFNFEANLLSSEKGKIKNFDRTIIE